MTYTAILLTILAMILGWWLVPLDEAGPSVATFAFGPADSWQQHYVALHAEPELQGRHRLVGHPQPYRDWMAEDRPAGALTPTRSDRRRVQEMAWRTYCRPYRLAGRVLVRADKGMDPRGREDVSRRAGSGHLGREQPESRRLRRGDPAEAVRQDRGVGAVDAVPSAAAR